MTRKNFEFLEVRREAPKERWAPERIEDFNEIQGNYSENKAKLQASRCLDCGNPYCQFQCPVQNYIPQWLKLVQQGRILEAAELSHQTNSLPEICGRVCPQDRLCEGSCTLDDDFGAVNIGAIEKYITDTAFEMGWEPQKPSIKPTGKTVAIIGAGPAGLACADILIQNGITPIVYDRYPQIGGLLSFGIPSFKLEKEVVEKRRKILEGMGVIFKLNTDIGRDIAFDDLYQNHDAVFIAVGTYNKVKASIPGENLAGVYQALDYLTNNNYYQMGLVDKKAHHNFYFERVVILGGGDTAMDCSRTAIRQEASSVYCAYRRHEKAMPGSYREVYKAKEEGVKFLWHHQPIEIIGKDKVEGVKFAKTELVQQENTGKMELKVIEDSEIIIPAERVVIAFGFKPNALSWLNDYQVKTDQSGRIIAKGANKHPFQTSDDKIFAGGDIRRGADLVVTAIFEGRSAAKSILNYLSA
ncbi:glutamate synthase subunit beta [Fangia hongkongensis]|uniref:glutamate synthase subunit beta n=1 Tax=Fangia hongkongensis TaxID=270495 RepID=UPI00036B19CA|nr:glutamate synthase subunit beta [Fangia hongkongensis]MBK2126313.1 glutamate synthase subunit beta [Fangia hongkongensis]